MTKTERCAVFAAIICGFSLTAGITDMMVSESNAISWRASTAGAQSLYGPVQNVTTPDFQQQEQQISQELQQNNSAIFSCVKADGKWKVVDGNSAGPPLSAPLYPTAKSCMKQVNDWNTP